MILGMNWLKKFNPKINWDKEVLRFGPETNEDLQIQQITEMAINVTLSHSQRIDQEHERSVEKPPKTIEELVP
jgi:hypothetical protein